MNSSTVIDNIFYALSNSDILLGIAGLMLSGIIIFLCLYLFVSFVKSLFLRSTKTTTRLKALADSDKILWVDKPGSKPLFDKRYRINAKPDFILLSGDISNEVRDIIEATRILKGRFPATPVYVSDGNHDVNLGFYNRANLTDPERLGPGTGTRDWTESSSPDEGDQDLSVKGEVSQRLFLLESVWNATGWLSAPWCASCLATFRQSGESLGSSFSLLHLLSFFVVAFPCSATHTW